MQSIFLPTLPVWDLALRTTMIYVGMIILMRIGGKREIGQLTPFDVVVLLMIGNAIQNGMVGTDSTVGGSLIVAALIIGLNYLVATLGLRLILFGRVLRGQPTLLVNNGEFIDANLRREQIDADDVLMAMREHGIGDVRQVKMAVLETDGSISIVPVAGTSAVRTRRYSRFLRRRD